MITVTSNPSISQILPVSGGQASREARRTMFGQASAAEAGALQGVAATSIADLHNDGRPELRLPIRVSPCKQPRAANVPHVGDSAAVQQAIKLSRLLADLMAMLLTLELGDSKMIINSSRRETALAASQARTMIESGRASMSAGISKAAAMGLATFAGAGLTMRGLSRQIAVTKKNTPRMTEMSTYDGNPGKKSNVDVTDRTSTDVNALHSNRDMVALKTSRNQVVGNAIQQVSTMSAAAIDGSSSAITSSLGASRETLSGEAAVQGRQTDIDIKARARNEGLKEQTLANIRGIIQNQLDVMAHVAQNTRV